MTFTSLLFACYESFQTFLLSVDLGFMDQCLNLTIVKCFFQCSPVIGFGLYKTLSFPYLPNLPSSFNSVHWSDTYQPTDPEGNACGRLVALEFSHLPIQSKKCHMFIMYRSLEGNSSFMEKAVQRQGLFIWSLLTEYWESSKIQHLSHWGTVTMLNSKVC